MEDFRSITVYVSERDIDWLSKLCCELPYLSCVIETSYPYEIIREGKQKIYPVDLMFDMVEGD